jgi:DNA-binding NtrC family response regulator
VRKQKVLVVDDDKIVIKSCVRILETEGFQVSTVPDADAAMEIVRQDTFDLMLIDVKMPKRDGLYLTKEIRKDFPVVPIVVMSGYSTPETVAEAFESGATKFIAKPFRPDELMHWIGQVLKKPPEE